MRSVIVKGVAGRVGLLFLLVATACQSSLQPGPVVKPPEAAEPAPQSEAVPLAADRTVVHLSLRPSSSRHQPFTMTRVRSDGVWIRVSSNFDRDFETVTESGRLAVAETTTLFEALAATEAGTSPPLKEVALPRNELRGTVALYGFADADVLLTRENDVASAGYAAAVSAIAATNAQAAAPRRANRWIEDGGSSSVGEGTSWNLMLDEEGRFAREYRGDIGTGTDDVRITRGAVSAGEVDELFGFIAAMVERERLESERARRQPGIGLNQQSFIVHGFGSGPIAVRDPKLLAQMRQALKVVAKEPFAGDPLFPVFAIRYWAKVGKARLLVEGQISADGRWLEKPQYNSKAAVRRGTLTAGQTRTLFALARQLSEATEVAAQPASQAAVYRVDVAGAPDAFNPLVRRFDDSSKLAAEIAAAVEIENR